MDDKMFNTHIGRSFGPVAIASGLFFFLTAFAVGAFCPAFLKYAAAAAYTLYLAAGGQ